MQSKTEGFKQPPVWDIPFELWFLVVVLVLVVFLFLLRTAVCLQ
jgi:hypothetical protein